MTYGQKYYQKNKEKMKKMARTNYWKNREKRLVQQREWHRKAYEDEKWREKHREQCKRYYRKNIAWYKLRSIRMKKSKKHAARQMVNIRVRTGTIIRPKFCDACNIKCKPHAHHHRGYDYPLSVIWLCQKCHGITHRKY